MERRRRARRVRAPRSREHGEPDLLPYPCYFLCTDCGWLEEGTTGHPHRRERDGSEPGACPSCSAKAWVDLRSQSVALAYREAETVDGDLADDDGRTRGVWIGALVSIIATAAVGLAIPELVMKFPVLLTAGGLGAWLLGAVVVNALSRRTRPGRARPRRWRRPLPRPRTASSVKRVVYGVVEGEASLQTPLGGEPCLGWTVQVWNDEGMLLDEQHHAALEVDGRAFEADTITLDLAPRGTLRPPANDDAFARFMRRRGLSPHDATLRVYESRLCSAVPVALHHHRSPRGSGPVLCQAPRELAF